MGFRLACWCSRLRRSLLSGCERHASVPVAASAKAVGVLTTAVEQKFAEPGGQAYAQERAEIERFEQETPVVRLFHHNCRPRANRLIPRSDSDCVSGWSFILYCVSGDQRRHHHGKSLRYHYLGLLIIQYAAWHDHPGGCIAGAAAEPVFNILDAPPK